MKVWILMAGQYSDKRLVGVFSSEEKALEFRKRYDTSNEYWDPFEEELDALIQDDRIQYIVYMDLKTGNNAKAEICDNTNLIKEPSILPIRGLVIYNRILAYDIIEAIKILNEQRIWYLQQNIHYLQEENEK